MVRARAFLGFFHDIWLLSICLENILSMYYSVVPIPTLLIFGWLLVDKGFSVVTPPPLRVSPLSVNRQLAKLSSGNEVRGKVAIVAVQMAVNFNHSLSRWSRKVSWAQFPPDSEKLQRSRTSCRASESSRHISSGKKTNLFDRKRGCMARNGDPVDRVACLAPLKLWTSFFLFQQELSYN